MSAALLPLVAGAILLLVDLGVSVGIEAAGALTRPSLRRMASESSRRLVFLEEFKRAPSPYRHAALLLRQLSLLGATLAFVTAAGRAGWSRPALAGVATAAVLGVLIVEGLLARSLALANPRRAMRAAAPLLRAAHWSLWPLVAPLHAVHERIHADYRRSRASSEEEQDEEVEALIEVGERTGLLEAAEGRMMRGIVDLDETLVREIMTPRTEIVALEATTAVEDAARRLLEVGHSRLPVYSQSIDNVVGILHWRDLLGAWQRGDGRQPVSRFVRPVAFVPETLSAANLLAETRQRAQMALVVDEYGGIAGLVTLEDVLEEIVGDIRDEHDDEEQLVRAEAGGAWVVDAVAHVEELEALFGVAFGEREFDTVGGLVVATFGRVPRAGEWVEAHGLRFDVLKADHRRVQRVRVRRAETAREAAGGP